VLSSAAVAPSDAHRAIEAVWRIESPRLIGALVRLVRDLGVAEELAHDALIAALEQWPRSGVPERPGAWLMATARHRAIDVLRRNNLQRRKHEQLAPVEPQTYPAPEEHSDDPVGDDVLRLMFTACHPLLPPEARVALTLRLLGGLTTGEIARAFLVSEPTVAQRLVRAKRTLREARVPFEIPDGADLVARLSSVLQVIYLIFNEGYSATQGEDWIRPTLCEEAQRLGRILAELAPAEPEVHGLLALLEIQASRLRARVDSGGEPVLLLDQDRARWDPLLIQRGLLALERAERLSATAGPGPYTLQAAIAACHARARQASETDWTRIAALYAQLLQVAPSPIVALNRAVAVGMAMGPEAGLELADALLPEPSLRDYHLLPSVRAHLLEKAGRSAEARSEYSRAAALTRNARERRLLLERAARIR
jgi:RNA polymerase sigma factor (sigma-70 family)